MAGAGRGRSPLGRGQGVAVHRQLFRQAVAQIAVAEPLQQWLGGHAGAAGDVQAAQLLAHGPIAGAAFTG